jgi:hypothetical protein
LHVNLGLVGALKQSASVIPSRLTWNNQSSYWNRTQSLHKHIIKETISEIHSTKRTIQFMGFITLKKWCTVRNLIATPLGLQLCFRINFWHLNLSIIYLFNIYNNLSVV